MKKFEFRLEKVLEYRRMVEDWAKKAYLESQQRLVEAQNVREAIMERRGQALLVASRDLEERRTIDVYVQRLDDEEQMQLTLIGILEEAMEKARDEWIEKRREAEALQTLRDEQYAEWRLAADRAEQADLDEWAVLRRKAA